MNDYTTFINSHTQEFALEVNRQFELSKNNIKEKLLSIIKTYIDPIPKHYKWEDDNWEPYDYSGIIVEDGLISLDQTVSEFLENEYSGNKDATYESECGWYYRRYGDELSYETSNIAYEIMMNAIKEFLEKSFTTTISEDELETIKESCNEFDEIYDSCIAYEFFSYEPAIEFVNIGNIKLSKLQFKMI